MLRESQTAVVARNETWTGSCATEPFEAGWAQEAIFFVRALKAGTGQACQAHVEISPDGMRWVREGGVVELPVQDGDGVAFVRVAHFGNWLRLAADLPHDASRTLLVTLHLK
ncbi:hypothetical protein ABOZ73_07800 [Caulobacter sp. 73W]|uniref:Uncharacterized protein n=1 Tax=Caulobacter sp. 73W TaxID=3161137 RepID=A0AB39KXP0_9CAUL